MAKKLTSILLVALMLISLMPMTVFATEEDDDSITVYLSISNDGWYLNGNDSENTTIARVPFTIEYFDLADYGLEDFYRYESETFENGGGYINDTVVEQPTLLHLLIKATEKYRLNGEKYDPVTDSDVLSISGSSTSMFIQNFWRYGYNLNYYVDDQYPLMAQGWGATADYILLEDGMDIDLACFTNWYFYTEGGFASLSPQNTEVSTGDTVDFQTYISSPDRETWSYETTKTECSYLTTLVLDDTWNIVDSITENYENNGKFSYCFDEAGTYYVVALDPNIDPENIYAGSTYSAIAPAVAEIIVTDNAETYLYGDVNKDGKINVADATLIQKYIVGLSSFDETTKILADVNNDGAINVIDTILIQKYIIGYDVSSTTRIGDVYTK
ncbi:MAG: dockerin type I repeat-containing protein [Acutalibacteraceae bacterium]|nr:dockerin type I repeat-containing protein [Acutalibacteraceae bacterium]